jgi:hypothetical protein
MRSRRLLCTLALCAVTSPAVPVLAVASLVDIPAVLSRDERLTAPLAVKVKDRPLGEVLPELGKELGVPLSAARETADDADPGSVVRVRADSGSS